MYKNMKNYWISLVGFMCLCLVASGQENRPDPNQVTTRSLPQILSKMQAAANGLKTLSADMEYLYIQDPDLIDARTLRKGKIYYKDGSKDSKLLMSFLTTQQDEGPIERQPEYFIFDGVWLTKIDMKLETVDRYQKAPEDHPVGVFEFISHNFPMVGFSEPNKLQEQFEITLAKDQTPDSTHLHLKVKKDSIYKDDYTKIDVWVNNQTWLPTRLTAWSTQGDFYDLKWTDIKINKKLENNVFTVETPAYFRKNTHLLNDQNERK